MPSCPHQAIAGVGRERNDTITFAPVGLLIGPRAATSLHPDQSEKRWGQIPSIPGGGVVRPTATVVSGPLRSAVVPTMPESSLCYPNLLCIKKGSRQRPHIHDESSLLWDELTQHEAHRRRNHRRNVRRHHATGEQDLTHPVSRDEASEGDEITEERGFRLHRNARRRKCRATQDQGHELAGRHARLPRDNPPLPRNLQHEFIQAMQTPSQVESALA